MATVRDNETELRYELVEDGVVIGELRYRRLPHAVALVHTEVEPAYEGRGYATQLIEGAVQDVQRRGLRLIPICPLVLDWLGKHPEYSELVASDPDPE